VSGATKVTVLMSVYNGERYLREAVESILGQTFADLEFLIINDGSTDGTREILESYTDSRIRVVHQANIGIAAALNVGIRLANGEHIAGMDADDVSAPERLARQVELAREDPGVAAISTGARVLRTDREEVRTPRFSDSTLPALLLEKNPLVSASVLLRRSALLDVGGYGEQYPYAHDREMWLRLAWAGERFRVVEEPLYIIRKHSASVSVVHVETQADSDRRATLAIVREFRRDPKKYSWIDRAALRNALATLSWHYRQAGWFGPAREAALAMLALNRTDAKAYKLMAAAAWKALSARGAPPVASRG